jgi:hypothetical protein
MGKQCGKKTAGWFIYKGKHRKDVLFECESEERSGAIMFAHTCCRQTGERR